MNRDVKEQAECALLRLERAEASFPRVFLGVCVSRFDHSRFHQILIQARGEQQLPAHLAAPSRSRLPSGSHKQVSGETVFNKNQGLLFRSVVGVAVLQDSAADAAAAAAAAEEQQRISSSVSEGQRL